MFRRLRTSITDTKQAPGDLRAISNIIGDGDTTIEASRTVKIRNYPRAPSSRRSGLVGTYSTPTDSQTQFHDIYTTKKVL